MQTKREVRLLVIGTIISVPLVTFAIFVVLSRFFEENGDPIDRSGKLRPAVGIHSR